MAYKRLQNPEEYGLIYTCDAEADLADLPADARMAFVGAPDAGRQKLRIRLPAGTWAEVD